MTRPASDRPTSGAPERCPAEWCPKAGGPGYRCAKTAGHTGLHDPDASAEESR